MEYTILGCDFCPKRPKPKNAVGSREVDLCDHHMRAVDRARGQRPRGRPRHVEKKKRRYKMDRTRATTTARAKDADARLLRALKEAGAKGLRGAALAKAARLSKHVAWRAAARLRARKQIVKRKGRMGFVMPEWAKEAA